jgi:hypothetical protein
MTYQTKLAKYRATCINMARLEVLTLKFYVASGAPNTAALFAMRAARWYFSRTRKHGRLCTMITSFHTSGRPANGPRHRRCDPLGRGSCHLGDGILSDGRVTI